MSQVINTNVASLNAQRNLQSSQSSLATSLQRLSSGLRINSAKDDAAGLAISERFTTQIRGINQAIRNANDGISLAQVGESALAEVTTNLQRIRELAVQSANATNSDSDRAALDLEVQQRLAEIDRVASQTAFNGRKLLDGSFGSATFQIGAEAGQSISLNLGASASTRLSAIGQVATTTTAGAIGASSTGGSNTVAPSSLLFGTAGSVDGSLTVSASNRLFGDTGVSDTLTLVPANADFATGTNATQDGTNIQTVTNFDYSGAGLAQFDVTVNGDTIGVTLNANYTDATGLAAAIEAQVQLGAGDLATTTVSVDGDGNIRFENVGNAEAVEVSAVDANASAAGFVNDGGQAGGAVGAQFLIDGIAVSLTTDLDADVDTFASGIQTALNAAAPGTYTVELTGNDIEIRNNNAGSAAVTISGANDIAAAAGIVNSTGTTEANPATEGTFQIENGATDIDITLDENYADFDALAAAIQTQLDAAAADTFTVTNNAGSITIARDAGGVVEINSANGRASGAGFGPTAGVVTTNASFDVDGNTVTLATDYADYDAMATDIGTQLGSGYTVTNDSGTISIVNNTPGSSGVVISNADANALAAGITESAGTDGIGEGSVTLSDFSINGVSVTGSFANADALATAINTSVSGVYATVNNGSLSLSSSQAITLGGADATGALGFASTSIEANSGSLSGGNVTTVSAANEMIQRIDSALTSVSTFRSTFGAIQNRFESVTANLTSSVENLSASRSRILDADFAAETANLTRAQILQQAGVAMLAQANALPQNVLSLLR